MAGHAMTLELAYDRLKRPWWDGEVESVIATSPTFFVKLADGVGQSLECVVIVEFPPDKPNAFE